MKMTLIVFLTTLAMSMADHLDEPNKVCELPTEPDSNLLLQGKHEEIRPLGSLVEENATAAIHAKNSDAIPCARKFAKIMKQVLEIENAQHGIPLPMAAPISLLARDILHLQDSKPHFKNVLKDLKDIASGTKKFGLLPEKDRIEMLHALEEIAERIDVEQAIAKDKGLIITEECLELLSDAQNADEDEEFVEGDIRLPDADAVELFQAGMLAWDYFPNPAQIPICFDPAMSQAHKDILLHATQHYTDHVPCVGFVEVAPLVAERKCSVKPGIWAQQGSGNSASLGASIYAGGPTLTLSDAALGIAVHELGHAIGMAHEQSRPDASQYVKIKTENVIPERLHNFHTHMDADTSVPYDIMSVMHYTQTAFSKNGETTLEEINPDPSKVMGQRMGLSKADVQQVANMYGCPSEASGFKQCTNNMSHAGTEEKCACHRDPNPIATRVFKATENGRSWCAPHCLIGAAGSTPCKCSVGYSYGEFWYAPHSRNYYYCQPTALCHDADPNFCANHKDDCHADGDKNEAGSLYWQIRQKCSATCNFCRKCEDMHPECHLYKETCGSGQKWFGMIFDHVCRVTCHQC
jgi:hypothetical protein